MHFKKCVAWNTANHTACGTAAQATEKRALEPIERTALVATTAAAIEREKEWKNSVHNNWLMIVYFSFAHNKLYVT